MRVMEKRDRQLHRLRLKRKYINETEEEVYQWENETEEKCINEGVRLSVSMRKLCIKESECHVKERQ